MQEKVHLVDTIDMLIEEYTKRHSFNGKLDDMVYEQIFTIAPSVNKDAKIVVNLYNYTEFATNHRVAEALEGKPIIICTEKRNEDKYNLLDSFTFRDVRFEVIYERREKTDEANSRA